MNHTLKCNHSAKTLSKARWIYLIICCIGLLSVGIIYGWSIMKVPLIDAFHWNSSQLATTYTVSMCFFCIGSLISGIIAKKFSCRAILIVSGLLIFSGYYLSSHLTGDSIIKLYFSYGCLVALGIGIAYNLLLSIGNSWFPDKKGTSSGMLMMCFGFSTMIFGRIASKLFDNVVFGWQLTYKLLGFLIMMVLIFCGIMLKFPDPTVTLPQPARKAKKSDDDFMHRDYETAEVIKRPAFWLFYLYGTLAASVGSTVISIAKELVITLGATASLAITLVGLLSIFNGLGRIICGILFDCIGRRHTMLIVSIVTILAPITMLFALQNASLVLGISALCLTGISYGCCPTISSAFISTFYGSKNFSVNYSLSNTKMLFSSFAAMFSSILLTSTGSYTMSFIMLTVLAFFSLFLNLFIKHP